MWISENDLRKTRLHFLFKSSFYTARIVRAFFRNIPVLLAKRGRLAPRGIFICGADKARFPVYNTAAIDGLFSFGDKRKGSEPKEKPLSEVATFRLRPVKSPPLLIRRWEEAANVTRARLLCPVTALQR